MLFYSAEGAAWREASDELRDAATAAVRRDQDETPADDAT